VGIHITVIRHFIGGNTVISQGGVFMNYFDPDLGYWTPLIINSVQLFFVIICVLWIQKFFGKRQLFLFSIPALALTCLTLATVMYYEVVNGTLIVLCLYMFIYGISFISPAWAYPSETITAKQSLWVNVFHWITLCATQLLPPLVSKNMYHSNPYPIFYCYGAYGILCMFHIYPKLR
jgi:hypothetical protein